MLILTDVSRPEPVELHVAAENIGHFWTDPEDGLTSMNLRDGNFFAHIKESPLTIARMRAAWDARFMSSQVHANNWLPIAIFPDEKHGFRFVCCAYTDEKVQAKAEALRPPRQRVEHA